MDLDQIEQLLSGSGIGPPLYAEIAAQVAARLRKALQCFVYASSIVAVDGALCALARRGQDKYLALLSGPASALPVSSFRGERRPFKAGLSILLCETTHENAAALRRALPFTAPSLVGLRCSVGCGDRLGITTPGHVRAVRDSGLLGVFAQQSIREMERTGRSPEQVMDNATWGVFQEGYRDGFGSDADHLKTVADIDACLAAGFTLFTIDPGAYVDNAAHSEEMPIVAAKFERLPWNALESSPSDCRHRCIGQNIDLGQHGAITLSEETVLRAAAKYGAAIAHTTSLYRHLAARRRPHEFELEISVDETDTPTSPEEHFFVASELKRLGVQWVSLAPRFVGEFEKGVDYRGDLDIFEVEFARHAALARRLGPYKLSLHSGSDKFSVYTVIARHAEGLFHLKTAGTSYLEALRVVALCEPTLFREILAFAIARYPEDRVSYHVSADPSRAPQPGELRDAQLAGVLDQFDAREVLHVTFGSVLNATDDSGYRFRDRLYCTLREHEETFYTAVAKHIRQHIAPFARKLPSSAEPE